jgi:hypothetical protein
MENKLCKNCTNPFTIEDQDLNFYDKVSPIFNGKKYQIPSPTLCPGCRQQRRMAWRNDRNLYERTCDVTGKKLISMFKPGAPVPVYEKEYWWSDKWDARDFGQDFDFSRPFFEQFGELLKRVPNPHVMIVQSENSLYTNYNYMNKNCYLCFAGNNLQDSLYCYNAENSQDCVDCLFVYSCELCFQCVHCKDCYDLKYSLHSKGCSESAFLEDCIGCKNCFMCWNLKNKEYCFMNKEYSREEYEKIIQEFSFDNYSNLQKALKKWSEERGNYVKRSNHNLATENCTGDYILNSKNCNDCYMMGENCEDCRYIVNGFPALKDSYDCTYSGEQTSQLYECMASGADCYHELFCNVCATGNSDVYYCNALFGSKNCFGCICLRNAEYCILNKQYSREEYEELVPRIIEKMVSTEEWGEFPAARLSPFGYNETLANEYFPLNKEEATAKGFTWSDYEAPAPKVEKVISANQIPDNISDVSDDILSQAIACEQTQKPFKITPQELKFYRLHGLSIPRLHPDERHKRRMELKNPYEFWERKCDKCGVKIETTYSLDRAKRVYCERCYLGEFY